VENRIRESVNTFKSAYVCSIQCNNLCLAKIPSSCIFIASHRARVRRSSQILTVKASGLRFNSTVGRSFDEAQVYRRCLDDGKAATEWNGNFA